MSVTPWVPTVTRISDGDIIDQATLNTPIDQLTQRDQHLYDKFAQLSNKSVLVVTDQPIHPKASFATGELSLAYYKSDSDGAGLAKGTTGFTSNSSSSMFTPNTSNYSFGLVKSVNPLQNTADLFIEGLCELDVALNDSTLGLIQKDANGVVETFAVGPYYLSAKSPGKITRDPAGIPVYVGYAISTTKFILHTNVDEFSQFFINYRFHILDRVAGTPVYNSGTATWTITNVNLNALGWVPATGSFPTGALFRYNIPSADTMQTLDNYTTTAEQQEAAELSKNLPPIPANFNQLYVNGVLARYNDQYDTLGRYSIDSYGIWWYSNKQNEVPWSQSYPTTSNAPANWASIKTTLGTTSRVNTFISFAKFNPALRTQLVSSLAPMTSPVSNFIKFYSKDNPTQQALTGDLLVDIDAPISAVGYAASTLGTLTDYPTASTATYTAGRALAAMAYSKTDGAFKAVVTPVVSKLTGTKGIGVTDTGAGVWQISYLSEGAVGLVDSIEPVNARLEFRGLSSYLKLPAVYTTSYGFVGKIVLPKGYFTGKDLYIVFHLFGDVSVASGGNGNVAMTFEYSTVSAINGAYPVIGSTSVGTLASPPVTATFSMGTYNAYTSTKVSPSLLVIPGAAVSEDSIVNFKITRVAPIASAYTGNIGILATYWSIPSAAT